MEKEDYLKGNAFEYVSIGQEANNIVYVQVRRNGGSAQEAHAAGLRAVKEAQTAYLKTHRFY